MIAVLFEVVIKEGCMDGYLNTAAELKDALAAAKGFIRSERFSSLVQERKLLSLSFWEDEAAVEAWRNQMQHRQGQQKGRESVFESYCITVTSAIRQYTQEDRVQAPADSNAYHCN